MTTLGSPISTRPIRWWIAISLSPCFAFSSVRAREHLLGHLRVRLVLEVEHRAPARAAPHGADEGRDGAGVGGLDLRDRRGARSSGSALSRNAPPETGGISATSSPSCELAVALRVLAVHRVEEPRRLVAEREGGQTSPARATSSSSRSRGPRVPAARRRAGR